jgi:hypothetical protein
VHPPPPLQFLVPTHSLSGSVPARTSPQVPSVPLPFFAAVHARQVAEQSVLQHTPSTQLPLRQSLAVAQVVPFWLRHTPAALHAAVPGHSLSGSVSGATCPQLPSWPPPFFAALHAWQVPAQAELQQTPSTQLPLEQFAPTAHAVPLVATHAPALQKASPGHSLSGSTPAMMLVQNPFAEPVLPTLQPWQVPVHAVLQQTPSTQLPLVQVDPTVQVVPSGKMHAPAPLHTAALWHSLSGS